MDGSHPVKLFRHGEGHAVDIPAGFDLPGDDAVMRQEGQRLIIEPASPKRSLLDLLSDWAAEEPLAEHEQMPPIPRSTPRQFDL